MDAVVVVAGGGPPHPRAAGGLPAGCRVVAADSGLVHAQALGLDVDLVVGDMDSVDGARLDLAAAEGVRVERHPVAKDHTDLELALRRASEMLEGAAGRGRIVVIGGAGGRLDHLLAVAMLLASPAYADVAVEARLGPALLHVVRKKVTLRGRPGDLVTLLPVHGPVVDVTTDGLRYPLERERLPDGTSRGVSNELVTSTATVSLSGGVLLVIQPAALEP